MDKRDYVVLSTVVKTRCATVRDLAAKTGYSLGMASDSLKYLIAEGYLDKDYFLTQKTIDLIHRNGPRQAVILAAGTGSRMLPINQLPKPLLTVSGEPLIERLINQLHVAGIYNISVVVGYGAEHFRYLSSVYQVELIENPRFSDTGSLHSLNCAASRLDNCYVVNADMWFGSNIFSRTEYNSWYAVRSYFDDASYVRVSRTMELWKAEQAGGGNAMGGIAYLCADDAKTVIENLRQLCADPAYQHADWEQALFGRETKGVGYANVLNGMLVMDVNTYEDLRLIDSESKNLEDQRIELIADIFHVRREEISDIHALSGGMTNRSMHFCCGGKEYLMRLPGEGTSKLTSRERECAIYEALSHSDIKIADNVYYINANSGYKITEFWREARSCDPNDPDDVAACMRHLRKFHEQRLKVDFRFDLREQLDKYERLREDSMPFADYAVTRSNVNTLLDIAASLPREYCLSHIDAVYDNFLFIKGPDGSEQVRLIDWEYAGMSDPHVDVAMFCIYAYYDRKQIDATIDTYFQGACPDELRLKIYCYIAIAGLLWTNWCEYKSRMGVKYGAYEMRQYQYAKQFYTHAMELKEALDARNSGSERH